MQDLEYMKIALEQAKLAYAQDEVPVGAVIVCADKIIAKAFNTNTSEQNALKHAEINAINLACKKLKSKYLDNCTIYITLEPCLMCLGAIKNARIKKIYFGAFDLDEGSIISNQHYNTNKDFEWYSGLLKEESMKLLKNYFNLKRGVK